MVSRFGLGLAAATVAARVEAGLIHLGRTYGSTAEERGTSLPGDDIITAPDVQTDLGHVCRRRAARHALCRGPASLSPASAPWTIPAARGEESA
jgi:hypothetical protein